MYYKVNKFLLELVWLFKTYMLYTTKLKLIKVNELCKPNLTTSIIIAHKKYYPTSLEWYKSVTLCAHH